MKFGQEYKQALLSGNFPFDFPEEWISSAISYGQLKKCIREVSRELAGIGLDPSTLNFLVDASDSKSGSSSESKHGKLFDYSIAEHAGVVRPKLTIIVESQNGLPMNARLSSKTKEFLSGLAFDKNLTGNATSETQVQIPVDAAQNTLLTHKSEGDSGSLSTIISDVDSQNEINDKESSSGMHDNRDIRKLEIPLQSDSKFFGLLKQGLLAFEILQENEGNHILSQVADISETVAQVTIPSTRSDLYQWREIFDLYIQAEIFFSKNETHHGERKAHNAAKQLRWFENQVLQEKNTTIRFKVKQSRIGLEKFFRLNRAILQNLQFQEINEKATIKIMKKFNKRTALSAEQNVSSVLVHNPFLARKMAQAVCFKIAQEIMPMVPQLNDYLCPVCFSVSYKPIRLECGHIFCIRCMITMQRAEQDQCPLCRGRVVMKADSNNLDMAMINFLKRYFPVEVKLKQKENERAATVDKYGEKAAECFVM